MSGPRHTAKEAAYWGRAAEASKRVNHIAWLRSTIERFPFRNDLRAELAALEGDR